MDVDRIAAERTRLVQRLEGLSHQEWNTPSLCLGWSVKHVLAHLITPFEVSLPRLMVKMARYRGFDNAMAAIAHKLADDHSSDELLQIMRDNVAHNFRPPGSKLIVPFTEVVCHTADILWALGEPVADWAEPARLKESLGYIVSPKAKGLRTGIDINELAFEATDQEWQHGHGLLVTGPSVALITALIGRTTALSALEGPGVERLAGAATT